MAEDSSNPNRGIDWRQVMSFTLLFKSFRVAAHPSKIILALTLLLLLYAGGRALDAVWPGEHGGHFMPFFSGQVNHVTQVVEGVRDVSVWRITRGIYDFLITGPVNACINNPVYSTIYGIYFLIIWSVFGGAVARVAAVHVARDEKISVRQALRFSVSKFLSFFSAPLIPALIIGFIGLATAAAALVGNIPFVGPLAVGVLFIVPLLAAFVVTLILIGTFGGFNLMYPTIAVEGSDSFDAISRSFSYVYARPWRMLFFTAVSVVYGALTYLFVRLFIWVMLSVAHLFVGVGMFTQTSTGADTWQAMWPSPTGSERLTYAIDNAALGTGGDIGAFFVAFWVYLVVGVLGAFAISFYFSANTIIYFLMRNEVDATELDDVYIEQSDDDLLDRPLPNDLTKPVDSSKLVESTKPMESTVPTDSTKPIESSTPKVIDAGRSATSSDSSPSSDASPSSIASIDLGTLDAPNPPTTPPTQP